MEIFKEIKKYHKIIKNPEKELHIYDGRGNIIDIYVCDHDQNHKFLTYYKDYGVTPMYISCHECISFMCHTTTIQVINYEEKIKMANGYWYRPNLLYFIFHPKYREHLLLGGLILKKK